MKKDKIKKKCHNKTKLSTKQKMIIANYFRKILEQLVKTQFQQNKQQSCLRKQIHGLIILHFHIYSLLRNLYQLTKYNPICFLSHLKASHHLWWYDSRALFLSKCSRIQVCSPFNTNWFCCQIVLKCVMGAAKGSLIVTGIILKILLSGIEINVLWGKTYLVILPTELISNLCITT